MRVNQGFCFGTKAVTNDFTLGIKTNASFLLQFSYLISKHVILAPHVAKQWSPFPENEIYCPSK